MAILYFLILYFNQIVFLLILFSLNMCTQVHARSANPVACSLTIQLLNILCTLYPLKTLKPLSCRFILECECERSEWGAGVLLDSAFV